MHVAILIPGIMGTRLVLPAEHNGGREEEVWPPQPHEVVSGYKRIDKLQSPHLRPGKLIDKVACFHFYSYIQEQLATLQGSLGDKGPHPLAFGYDWRRDNFDTARALAGVVAQQHAQGATKISLVGHSMGGLVARLLLESGEFADKPWFSAIKQLVTLGTPHLGAPLALARIYGLDSTSGISGAGFRQLASNRAYPSGYQLIPAPGEAAIWVANSGNLAPLDPYDDAVAAMLGMDPVLVARAKAQYDALSGPPPAGVRYFYFAGTGQKTLTRVNVIWNGGAPIQHGQTVLTRTEDGGDGTVPLYSALPARGQRQIVTNEHATVFKGTPFRKVFFRLMGGNAGAALEAAPSDEIALAGTLESPVYVEGTRPGLTLTVTNRASADGLGVTDRIEGRLVLERTDDEGKRQATVTELPLTCAGPEVASLKLVLPMMVESGLYRLRFEGTPPMAEDLAFAVTSEDAEE